jgi:hypothetical protein
MSRKHKQQAANVLKIRVIGKETSVQHNVQSYKTISNQMFSYHETKLKQITDTFPYTDIWNINNWNNKGPCQERQV